ncbi:uncharacterized protein LY89DRAFT_739564 [Mollisia scopiformis]|uniref:Carboxylic ester hydrolase n=1 Tax=Mollisia scopiformis TaxID=149040 RepID=A0A194WTU2_MOLSC|nr:uncharacterized protein LY89DRAFT_739564 [Mollisia scopiformis]KUJ11375.1 hypothetical protein LY89DRAFT_739564 [Mollisia scopiformis]
MLPTLDNVTYDTLKHKMIEAWQVDVDSLETDWQDLTPFNNAAVKVIHFHGESDAIVPTAASVRYYESVHDIMSPYMTFNESAAHCATNGLEPKGSFLPTNLAVLIDWAENWSELTTLTATHSGGGNVGANAQLCGWRRRPPWTNDGTTMDCLFDQASYDTWIYDCDGVPLPVY